MVSGFQVRPAVSSDLTLLVQHRHAMWSAIGHRAEPEISEHDGRYRRWLRPRLRSGEVIGFIAQLQDRTPLGSGLVWFRSDQPRPKVPMLTLPYILSMYTEPAARGRGVGSRIVRSLVDQCRRRGYPSVVLHASEQGRSVYARLGFERTWEMRRWLDPALRRRRRATAAREAAREKQPRKRLDRGR